MAQIELDRLDVDARRPEVIDLTDAVEVGARRTSGLQRGLKRALDIALSFVMLVLAAPVFLAVAFAIKIDDGGPVFYRQERWGFKGRRFSVLKFRSMIPNADGDGIARQAAEDDDRVTRIGKLLRKTGLDELPQLINIFRGDMSFVGPRALAVEEAHVSGEVQLGYRNVPGFRERLLVRPGLTGMATIYLPKDAHPRQKFEQDVAYVENQSMWLDLRLITLSFWISFRGKWETRNSKF
jgi:lipopolysaccharide/colanic/teichoic acid biosynthesis glycosyltransferase